MATSTDTGQERRTGKVIKNQLILERDLPLYPALTLTLLLREVVGANLGRSG